MTNAALLGAVVTLATSGRQPPAADPPVEAPIVAVMVFGDRARVTRARQQARWPAGRVVLPRLPADADPDSVRLEVRGAGARLEWVTVHKLGPEDRPTAAIASGEAELARLDRELTRAKAQVALLENLLAATTGAKSETDADEPSPEASTDTSNAAPPARLVPSQWERALTSLDQEGRRLLNSLRTASRQVAQLERQRADQAIRNAAFTEPGGLLVSTALHTRGPAELRLTYEVPGPTWRPAYDIHLDPRTDQVTASLWAEVEQTTGEDWTAVELTVNTSSPDTPSLPSLPSWRIGERETFTPTPRSPFKPRPPSPPASLPLPAAWSSPASPRSPSRHNVTESFDLDLIETNPRSPAASTGSGGQLIGYVFDQAGNPLHGVKILVNNAGSPRTAYTNTEGAFRIVNLPPGICDVQASAPKLRSVLQRDVKITADRPAEVNLIMEVAGGGIEEVRVVERAPLVATSVGHVRESFPTGALPSSLPSASARSQAPRMEIALLPPETESADVTDVSSGPLADAAQGHRLRFPALTRETIPSGKGVRRVPLGRYPFSVKAERHLYPALAQAAFVVAQLRSPAATYLPGGPATLSVGADPAGEATLNLVVPGQAFTLPLGVDRALRPVRRVTQQSRTEGLLSKREITRYTVVTEISNPHPWPVRLQVHDQLPISGDGTVKVALLDASDRPRHDARTGTLKFQFTVAAGATRSVRFDYTLTRPRGHRLVQAEGTSP